MATKAPKAQDFRQLVSRRMVQKDIGIYRLSKLTGLSMQSLSPWLRGKRQSITSERLALIFAALDLLVMEAD